MKSITIFVFDAFRSRLSLSDHHIVVITQSYDGSVAGVDGGESCENQREWLRPHPCGVPAIMSGGVMVSHPDI